jgi:hypothetical protein
MNFSLILPSRERINLLENLLESLLKNTSDIDNIEVWIAFDWDDSQSVKNIKKLSNKFTFTQFLVTDRQNNLSDGYYNRLAKISNGKFVQVLNDDCQIVTNSWDEKAIKVLSEYQKFISDGILYGKAQDEGIGYSCFPLLSRQAIEAMGWFFHPEMTAWGADIHLHEVYSKVNRVIDLPYKVDHISHHTGKRDRDNVNYRLSSISSYNYASADGESQRLRNILKNNKFVF